MSGDPGYGWPPWWDWELELTSHLFKRMVDRRFSETDLRVMITNGKRLREDHEPGRWVVETVHQANPWEVIVEPDPVDQLLVVITAYPVGLP